MLVACVCSVKYIFLCNVQMRKKRKLVNLFAQDYAFVNLMFLYDYNVNFKLKMLNAVCCLFFKKNKDT